MPIVSRFLPWLLLLLMGAVWGLSISLIKILIAGGFSATAILLVEYICGAVLLAVIAGARGEAVIAPVRRHFLPIAFIALLGGMLPALLLYAAAEHVQAGVLAIIIALAPMAAYMMAILFGFEGFRAIRFGGLVLGLCAIALITLPEGSLPDRAALPWIFAICLGVGFIGASNVMIALPFARNLGPVRLALGLFSIGGAVFVPGALLFGDVTFPASPAPWLVVILAALVLIAVFADLVFFFAAQRYGPVFANQAGYIVTIAGVLWGIVLFGESHSLWIWAALVLVLAGVALVNPVSSVGGDGDAPTAEAGQKQG